MASINNKPRCSFCNKENATTKCTGCSQDFCFNHLAEHRAQLNKELSDIEVSHDIFRQNLIEKVNSLQNDSLIQQVNDWEIASINKIRETADNARKMIIERLSQHAADIEVKLNKFTDELRVGHRENDFTEQDLARWNNLLGQLNNDLSKSVNVIREDDAMPLIKNININVLSNTLISPAINPNVKWRQNGIIVAGGNQQGSQLNELFSPWNLFIDDDSTIYVVDQLNHRIVEWKHGATLGRVVAGGNGPGDGLHQLKSPKDVALDKKTNSLIICDLGNLRVVQWPRTNNPIGKVLISNINCLGIALDNYGYMYVSDYKNNTVQRWRIGDNQGLLVAGGNGSGNHVSQLNQPTNLFIGQDQSVYVSDWNNNRVMKWEKDAKEGIVVAGGLGQGNNLWQLSQPYGLFVDSFGAVYVADSNNKRIICWPRNSTQGNVVVGANETGSNTNQLNSPKGLSFDRHGSLYVVDETGHHVQRYDIDLN